MIGSRVMEQETRDANPCYVLLAACSMLLQPGHDFLRDLSRYPLYRGHLVRRRRPDLCETPEMPEQRLLSRLADARDIVQLRPHSALLAQFSVIGNGEAVRLIAHPGDQVRGRAGGFENDRLLHAREKHPLELLLRARVPAPRLGEP